MNGKNPAAARRIVITGIGCITPIGIGKERFWNASVGGESAVAPIPDHWSRYFTPSSTLWAPLPPIQFSFFAINRQEQLQFDKSELLAMACAELALRDAGFRTTLRDEKKNTYRIEGSEPRRWGVAIGTGIGGISSLMSNQAFHCGETVARRLNDLRFLAESRDDAREMSAMIDELKRLIRLPVRFNSMAVSMTMPSGSAATVGIKYGITGSNSISTDACAAGTSAIGAGYEAVLSGACDTVLAGGVEYLGDDFGGCFRGFDAVHTLVRKTDDPLRANRPFDRDRSGFLFAEGGGAILVLEEREQALRRGATIYAEIIGFARTFDAYSIVAMDPEARAAMMMLTAALAKAGRDAGEIDYINAHGTGTSYNDEIESSIIERFFGKKPLINSTKSLIGHTIGAAGAIEAAVTALSTYHQTTHISKNLENPVRDLNFVTSVRACDIRYSLSQSFAFGGYNACLVFSRHSV